ncbi:mitochondrial arginine transporter BAC1 isoform X1 [Cryptomeria japonica]|uniref:mitochondrial arginine transporter BAC1 isoform X1 n=2 Tax=Cryptomeria japonica TaxID=3369 RepID=UPI0027DA69E8|nr:mitochondrial arginine transporter BAC1 isoform X1 [Cryptomeria japonica]
MDAWKEYGAGCAAGIATVITGHPFDTVKVKLQTQNTEAHSYKYRNALHCTTHILKTEGVKGLYTGATSSFAGMAMESSLLFGVYSQMKLALQGGDPGSGRPKLQIVVPSAAVGGALISFVLCPAELIKCRLQVQEKDNRQLKKHPQRYAGPLDCALQTLRNEKVQGLFRGGLTTFLRESIGNAVFFSTYELTRYHMLSIISVHAKVNPQMDSQSSQFVNYSSKIVIEAGVGVVSGGLAGIAFWSTILPLDVAKTRIQTAPDINASRNPIYTIRMIYRELGFRGLYAGLGPTLVRAFPANAAAIVTWEFTANLLGVKR